MKKIVYLVLIATGVAGCQEDVVNDSVETIDRTTVVETIKEKPLIKELEGLRLNDGQKWHVDASTHAGMLNIQQLLVEHEGVASKKLGDRVKDELKEIIKQCKMKGVDHEQYHIVLNAMLIESKAMKRGKVTDATKLQKMVDSYFVYFAD